MEVEAEEEGDEGEEEDFDGEEEKKVHEIQEEKEIADRTYEVNVQEVRNGQGETVEYIPVINI